MSAAVLAAEIAVSILIAAGVALAALGVITAVHLITRRRDE